MPAIDTNFDYQIDKNSTVFDCGCYQGDFAEMIRTKYGCGVFCFEPVRAHFKHIVERFKHDPMYFPHRFAFEDYDGEKEINLTNNSSSLYGTGGPKELIQVRDIYRFTMAFKLPKIDILKMNVEGSEYAILDRFHKEDWVKNLKNIVVQFHGIPGRDQKGYEELLALTHETKHKCASWQWWVKK